MVYDEGSSCGEGEKNFSFFGREAKNKRERIGAGWIHPIQPRRRTLLLTHHVVSAAQQ
jgi:hypothetical protein